MSKPFRTLILLIRFLNVLYLFMPLLIGIFIFMWVLSCDEGTYVDKYHSIVLGDVETSTLNDRRVEDLWANTVSILLQDNLWEEIYNYDAANVLMLPLHYGYSSSGTEQQKLEFREFYQHYRAYA